MNHAYRLRANLRGKLVLQFGEWVSTDSWVSGTGYWVWRDATVKDISMFRPENVGF